MIVTMIVEIEKSGDYLTDSFNVCTSSTIYSYSILSIYPIYLSSRDRYESTQ